MSSRCLFRSTSRSSAAFCFLRRSSLSALLVALLSTSRICLRISMSCSCCSSSIESPSARSVSSSSSLGFIMENAVTLSCGRNWHRFWIWMLRLATISSTCFLLTSRPLSFQSEPLVRLLMRRVMTCGAPAFLPRSVISILPNCTAESRLTKSPSLSARPSTLGELASPRQSAHTSDDFPVPLGPSTRLSAGPGSKRTCPNVMKLVSSTASTEPTA
mmetsp:Transcript_9996/g.31317  ORF Transcript_9996/g.31317 Transcript_9996/m.31317 type:complete len:216 (+) Transcript_9996:2596-3243(+)